MALNETHHGLDVATLRKDFPLLTREVHGHPHHLSGLGRLGPAPRPGPRRHAGVRRDDPRQRAPRGLRHRRGGHPAVRSGPAHRGDVHRRPRSGPRDRLHQERHRGHSTWSPTPGAVSNLRPGDTIAPHRDGAPRQHRAVAHAGQRTGPRPSGGSPWTTTEAWSSTTSSRWWTEPSWSACTCMSNVLGTLNPVRRDRRRRPLRRCGGGRRRCAVGSPPADVGH